MKPDRIFSSVDTISATYEEMIYLYCAQIRDGARKIMRLGGDGMKKPAFARIALNPTSGNKTRWEYPTVFLMHHASGLWLSRIIPRMEASASKETWKALTEQDKRKGAGGSGLDQPDGGAIIEEVVGKDKRKIYPSGKPLRLEERDLSRKFLPKSTTTGDYLCWDFISHAGCVEKGIMCSKGKHELMSTKGLHYSILMQMARRGGLRSSRRIEHEKIDRYIQALRDSASEEEKAKKVPPPKWEQSAWVPKKKQNSEVKAGGSDLGKMCPRTR